MLETALPSGFDADTLNTIENRFLDRIKRRTRFIRQLQNAGLGIYLSANDDRRRSTIESLVLLCAREGELSRMRPEVIKRATLILQSHIETMQSVLPHDVQYRNRMRQKSW